MTKKWMGIKEETTYGADAVTPDVISPYIGLDINPDQQRILELESYYRLKKDSFLGPFLETGTLTILARPELIGHFLKWTMGAAAKTDIATGVYKHTFTFADEIKSFVLWDNIKGRSARRFPGCLIKALRLEAPRGEVATLEAEIQAQWERLVSELTPDETKFETARPFSFYGAEVELPTGTVLAEAESIRLEITNNIPDDTHGLGSRKLPAIILEGTEIVSEMDAKFNDWDMRELFYGAQAATEPQTEEGVFGLKIKFTGSKIAGTYYNELVCTFPRVIVRENPATRTRQERLTERVILEILEDAGNKIELQNARSTDY